MFLVPIGPEHTWKPSRSFHLTAWSQGGLCLEGIFCRPICRPVGSIGEHVMQFVCIGLLSDTSPSSLINLSVNSSISSILSSILSSIRCYFIIYKIHHIKSGRLGRARDAGSWREPTRILTLSRQFWIRLAIATAECSVAPSIRLQLLSISLQ